MTTTKTSRTGKAVSRAQQIWAELDYVQRRMFELRTGVPAAPRENRLGSKQATLLPAGAPRARVARGATLPPTDGRRLVNGR